MFRGLQWEPVPGRPGIEMTANIGKEREPREVQMNNVGEDNEVIQRAFRIGREEVSQYGITPNCRECTLAVTGGTAQNHSVRCREVWEKRLIEKNDPRNMRQVERMVISQGGRQISSSSMR